MTFDGEAGSNAQEDLIKYGVTLRDWDKIIRGEEIRHPEYITKERAIEVLKEAVESYKEDALKALHHCEYHLLNKFKDFERGTTEELVAGLEQYESYLGDKRLDRPEPEFALHRRYLDEGVVAIRKILKQRGGGNNDL